MPTASIIMVMTTQRNIPHDSHLHTRRREILPEISQRQASSAPKLVSEWNLMVWSSGSQPFRIDEHYDSCTFRKRAQHKMSTGCSKYQTVYKYVKEHYTI
jgi:hypothetical protein